LREYCKIQQTKLQIPYLLEGCISLQKVWKLEGLFNPCEP